MQKKALATLLLLLIPLISVTLPQTRGQFTINVGVLAHEMTPDQAQSLALNGINWVRSDVSINDSETNWHTIYHLAKAYNFSLIGTLLPYTLNFNNSFTLQDWEFTVRKAVAEFGDIVKVWEIWNEPTFPQSGAYAGFYQGTSQQYVDLMKGAYQEIKSLYPYAIVLGLGGLPLYTSNEPIADYTYVEQALLNGLNKW